MVIMVSINGLWHVPEAIVPHQGIPSCITIFLTCESHLIKENNVFAFLDLQSCSVISYSECDLHFKSC